MRLQIVDFLKGYSIFTIVIYHILQRVDLPNALAIAINFGGAGIYVFILCSGFGLFLSQNKKLLTYFQFLKKRFLKIYIPYILIVLISACFPFVNDGGHRLTAILSHIFLFKMFNESYVNSFGEQFWFISMILQFYLVFPLLYIAVKKFRWKAVILAFVISLIWPTIVWFIGKTELRVWNSFFLHFLWVFVLGMMLAVKYLEDKSFVRIPPTPILLILAVAGMVLTGISGVAGGALKLYNDIPSMVGYMSVALLVYAAGITWINKFFVYTNQFSYEWYLIHMLIIDCAFRISGVQSLSIVYAACVMIISYLLAIGYNKLLKATVYSKI